MAKFQVAVLPLEQHKIVSLSKTLGSGDAQRILQRLGKKEATAAELAKGLSLPLSTVNTALGGLQEAGIITAKHSRNRKYARYKMAHSHAVLVPMVRKSTASRLGQIVPVLTIVALAAGLLQLLSKDGTYTLLRLFSIQPDETAVRLAATTPTGQVSLNVAPIFLVGAIFAILVFIAYDMWKEKLLILRSTQKK